MDPITAQMLGRYRYTGVLNPALSPSLLAAFDALAFDANLWPGANGRHTTYPYDIGLYNQTIWLGVTLSPATMSIITVTNPPPSGTTLTLLNQNLLQDAYTGLYTKGQLTPATIAAAQAYNASDKTTFPAFESNMTTDLNRLITSGVSLYWYNTNLWTPWVGGFSAELKALIALPNPNPAQLIRENRLLFEAALNQDPVTLASLNALSTSVLGTYRLVAIPTDATTVTAKAAQNLRASLTATGLAPSGSATVNFVNNGVPGWQGSSTAAYWPDAYLRAGDMNNDNAINLADYGVLQLCWPPRTYNSAADVNADGKIGQPDYGLMQGNWGQGGATDIAPAP